jgi:hypothetical protein
MPSNGRATQQCPLCESLIPLAELVTDGAVERAAEAMWTLRAEKDAAGGSICRNGPVERDTSLPKMRPFRPQRWDESAGAWRTEMLDMARAALSVLLSDTGES